VAFSRDSQTLASAGLGDEIRLWSAPAGELQKELAAHETAVLALAFAPNGSYMVSSGYERQLRLWSTQAWTEIFCLDLRESPGEHPLAISPDSRVLAVGSEYGVTLYSAETGDYIVELPVAAHGIYALDFSVEGEFLAVAATDRMLRIWNIPRVLPTWFLRGESPPIDEHSFKETGEM
jgi:WD40 repeat protein